MFLKNRSLVFITMLVLAIVLTSSGCGIGNKQNSDTPKTNVSANESACMTCHGDKTYLLTQVETSLDVYGHEVTAEVKANGLLVENGFMDSTHGRQSCESCHSGNPTATTKEEAHGGEFLADPTADGGSTCGTCHKEEYENFKTSLHFTQSGIRNKLSQRLGDTADKEQIVDRVMEGDCSLCHATCGDCHVSTPPVAEAGLQNGHEFTAKPDNLQTCIPCHHLAGPKYFTEEKDLHVSAGMDCVSCHSESQEFHGRGQEEEHMMAGVIEAKCTNCHEGVATSNEAHQKHSDKVACQSCHGDEYESCNSCHSRVQEHEEIFKLGEFGGMIFPFTHSGNDADMFAHMDIELDQEILDSTRETWHPYPSHFIQKAPIHKEGAESMCENCHGNEEIFLQEEDLVLPELEKDFLVDKIPPKLSK